MSEQDRILSFSMVIVLMGVAGCGKTTIGRMLARRLHIPFFDGDDFHSRENKLKMHSGTPLTDKDRIPWLEEISARLKEEELKSGAILACSALKEMYREQLQKSLLSRIIWIHLEGNRELIMERLLKREEHFMNPDLLTSQFEILEKPSYAWTISIDRSPEVITEEILNIIKEQ